MSQSDTVPFQVWPVTLEDTRTNKGQRPPSCFSYWLTSVIANFCIGLVTGFGGGLLLGKTLVIVLQCLEVLVKNKWLMDCLEMYMLKFSCVEKTQLKSGRTSYYLTYNILASSLVEVFGVCSSAWSLGVGVMIGLSTYDFIVQKYGEAAKKKALTLAGPVCLMGVTATGYLLGFVLEIFLSSPVSWLIPLAFGLLTPCISKFKSFKSRIFKNFLISLILSGFAEISIWVIFIYFLRTKLTLSGFLFPIKWILHNLNCDIHPATVFLPLMLIITDVFNIVNQPIIIIDSLKMTHIAVIEGLFVGVLTYQLFMVVVGMSLFKSWRTGGATTICFSAAALGGAVITVVDSVQDVLGPGPTIGALTGIAGAAGVSLAAAGAVTDQFGGAELRCPGWLGVTVGAAVGAFLFSCTHSGLSRLFLGLWAATMPAGLCVLLLGNILYKHETRWSLFLLIVIIVVIFFSYGFISPPRWFLVYFML